MPDSEVYEGWTPCEDHDPIDLDEEAQAAGSLYLTDLDVALRNGGIAYWESPGWRSRGHGGMKGHPRGILIHHTAGGGSNDWKTVQNGRPGLAGPLAQMTFERDSSVRLIAAGQCWHPGVGSHPAVGGSVGSGWLIGIEGVSKGVGNDWTQAQRANYPKLAAALCRHYRLPVSTVLGHKEYATPRGRKIDPGDWDMDQFRAEVARHLRGGGSAPAPTGRPTLRYGSNEPAVAELRRLLGMTVSNTYDRATETRVRDFQRANGLDPDGVCGPDTWRALEDDMPSADDILKQPIERAGGERSGQTSMEAMAAYLDSNLDLLNARIQETHAEVRGLRAILEERLPKAR